MTIAISILGLAFLILIHELGHFAASLALKMRPRRFYIGFPPAIWSTTRGGIEYGIGAIPLGGFVKIPGMHRPVAGDVDAGLGRLIEEHPELKEPTTALRDALARENEALARQQLATLRVVLEGLTLTEPARKTVARTLGDLDDALGPDAYWRAATWKRVAVIAAGPVANILLALVLFTGVAMTSAGDVTTKVDEVRSGSAAEQAGLRVGDTIVSIGGVKATADNIPDLVGASKGEPLTVVVERDGAPVTLAAASPTKIEGAYRLGFVLGRDGLPPGRAMVESFRISWEVTTNVGSTLGRLVTGEGRQEISSTVGIVQGSSEAAKQGTSVFLFVLGLISLSIALLNLLPLLPLDGGHIVFSVAEGVRGRAVTREVYERVSIVGIGLVLLLFFIGLQNDIGRLS